MKKVLGVALLMLSLPSAHAALSDFEKCKIYYTLFADNELNKPPKPKGKERAEVAMKGYKQIEKLFPKLTSDELLECATQATERSNNKAS